ncbi:MAG: hypothetical protein ACM33B_13000 [Pseudomonadota bacterium]
MRAALALAALALLAAGCGGGGGDAAEAGVPVAPVGGTPAPAPGRVLVRFVEAANREDAAAMWPLLSPETQETMGPTLPEFRRGLAFDVHNDVSTFRSMPRVVLSRRVGRWAVATVTGDRVRDDGEQERWAYGAAFRLVDGRWRLELGGVAFAGLHPVPNDEEDATPVLRAEADASGRLLRAAFWLDGAPQRVVRVGSRPFSGAFRGDPQGVAPGFHVVTVLATTPDTAAAVAWPFEVAD